MGRNLMEWKEVDPVKERTKPVKKKKPCIGLAIEVMWTDLSDLRYDRYDRSDQQKKQEIQQLYIHEVKAISA